MFVPYFQEDELDDSEQQKNDSSKIINSKPSSMKDKTNTSPKKHVQFEAEESFGQISFKIDLIAMLLFIVAARTRIYDLAYPHNIV